MNNSRTPVAQLDALLTGLENEVLRSDQIGPQLADESIGAEDIGAMRASIESMTHARTRDPERWSKPLHDADDSAPETGSGAAQMMRRLGRWAGTARGESAVPEVRMAFSGESPEIPEKTARKTAQRQPDSSNGGKRKDD